MSNSRGAKAANVDQKPGEFSALARGTPHVAKVNQISPSYNHLASSVIHLLVWTTKGSPEPSADHVAPKTAGGTDLPLVRPFIWLSKQSGSSEQVILSRTQ